MSGQPGKGKGQTMVSESLKIIKSGPKREREREWGKESLIVGAAVLSCQPKRNQAAPSCRDTVRHREAQ